MRAGIRRRREIMYKEKPSSYGGFFNWFCIYKPNSVLVNKRQSFIWDLCCHKPRAALLILRWARPCTRVRILPFHFHFQYIVELFDRSRTVETFESTRHCSHLTDCSGRALPATFFHQACLGSKFEPKRAR